MNVDDDVNSVVQAILFVEDSYIFILLFYRTYIGMFFCNRVHL